MPTLFFSLCFKRARIKDSKGADLVGLEAAHGHAVNAPGDPPSLVADATRACIELGWKPRYADLIQIVTTGWDWMLRLQSAPSIASEMKISTQ